MEYFINVLSKNQRLKIHCHDRSDSQLSDYYYNFRNKVQITAQKPGLLRSHAELCVGVHIGFYMKRSESGEAKWSSMMQNCLKHGGKTAITGLLLQTAEWPHFSEHTNGSHQICLHVIREWFD